MKPRGRPKSTEAAITELLEQRSFGFAWSHWIASELQMAENQVSRALTRLESQGRLTKEYVLVRGRRWLAVRPTPMHSGKPYDKQEE